MYISNYSITNYSSLLKRIHFKTKVLEILVEYPCSIPLILCAFTKPNIPAFPCSVVKHNSDHKTVKESSEIIVLLYIAC
jgi:hypothetical protein